MQLLGLGLDAVDLSEIRELVEHDRDAFYQNFTDAELTYARGRYEVERLAGRFAAKEAVMKALGHGWGNGLDFADIEVIRTETGAPLVTLHGRATEIAEERGITFWMLSLTHSDTVAVAVAIAASV